ncbi:MAG: DNA polymerase III subunit delta', partial [Actinomycetota bacterium]|nr:DNA polymerase III subunit delta' [Actinomycetota bacterium]
MSSHGPRRDPEAPVWPVPAQEHATGVLRASVERGDTTHAWAFVGPADVGQQRAARALAAALNCPEADPPCGACDVCDRCLRGVYPAYWEFAPTGAAHRVAEVRERWLPAAFRSAPEGRWKVLRVLEADRMNEAAANAFLKRLEEPPPTTSWVLEVADPDELPDTVLSRCRLVRFTAWGPAALDSEARRLGLAETGERALAVRACLGSP